MIIDFMAEKLIIEFDEYTKIVEKLAIEIHKNYKPTVLVGIMRGAAPIIKGFGGIPLVRGGDHKTFDGDDFIRTVVWEFPSYEQALKCHQSKEYLAGWNLAKETTTRHMQIIEGFSTE